MASTDDSLNIGSQLGVYEVIARLGAGGMGVVYKARDTKLGRLVALKFLRGDGKDAATHARLLREARNVSALNHPNIATIYEVGESDGRTFIAMEFVEGRPLNAALERGPLAPETAVRYALEIASALAHAHERGIIHRDLKPANVIVTGAGHVKVLDFGLAKRTPEADQSAVTISEADMTKGSSFSGTLLYMAPETLRGEPSDARTDVWALGAVLYEMLIGTPPFEGRTAYEISSAILREPPKSFPSHVPLRLQTVIQRCLSKEREHRYQRASEVHAVLEAIGADVIGPPAPSVAPSGLDLSSPSASRGRKKKFAIAGIAGVILVGALAWGGYALYEANKPAPPPASSEAWVQLTDFADSAVSPALSADGKILAFIHGSQTFFGYGEIDAKVLPNGDPVELTHDGSMKMSPEFSPDGSTIAYTVFTGGDWTTWTVPVLGGEARRSYPNVEGLTWIDPDHTLFSHIISGTHMSLVTGGASPDAPRDVYVPPRDRGMVHRSAISPDHKWVLLAEMDNAGWLPCRLVPFDGGSPGKQVGPPNAACTYAAWSPDGKWMYLNSEAGGRFHLWRQHFPDGQPEQITSGATEEEGIAVAPDGRSLITSVGLRQNTIWIRDRSGEYQISSQGYAEQPRFSHDGRKLYYLVRRHGISGQFVSGELWVADLATRHSQRVVEGFEVTGFDISPDDKQVVFSATGQNDLPSIWLASLDLQFAPRKFDSTTAEDQPLFDRSGNVYFRASEGTHNFLYCMKSDGSGRRKVYPDPILELHSVAPDGRWAIAWASLSKDTGLEAHNYALPLAGGAPHMICSGYCGSSWSVDGKYFVTRAYTMEGVFTMVVDLPSGDLPSLDPVRSRQDMERVKGARITQALLVPGPLPRQVAEQREEVHRNLYRIPLQ